MSYSNFFYNNMFQDGTLILLNIDDTDEVLDKIPIHRVVWTANSTYFGVYLKDWNSSEVKFSIDKADRCYFDIVIKSFYCDDPANLNMKDWFSVICLCDQLGVKSLIEEGMKYISINDTFDDALHFYNSKLEIRSVNELSRHFQSVLFLCFHNLVFIYETKIGMFLILPFYAVVEIVKDEKEMLKDSENLVLSLCILWMVDGNGKNATESEKEELCSLIRLSRLSSVFFMDIVPKLDWFKISKKEYEKIQKFRLMENFISNEAFGPGIIYDVDMLEMKDSWYLPDRSNSAALEMDSLSIGHCISEASIEEWVGSDRVFFESSVICVYWKGCFWKSVLMFDCYGTLYAKTECNVKMGGEELFPVDQVFTGSVTQRMKHTINFCHRTFQMTRLSEGKFEGSSFLDYLKSAFRFNSDGRMYFSFRIHSVM